MLETYRNSLFIRWKQGRNIHPERSAGVLNEQHKEADLTHVYRASLVAQAVKNLPAVQETRVQALGGEDPLEEKMATHSSILAERIPQTGEHGGL